MRSSGSVFVALVVAACGGSPPPAPTVATPAAAPVVAAAVSPAPSSPPPSFPPPAVASPPQAPSAPLRPGVVIVGEVVGPAKFDPTAALAKLKPELSRCYDETRTLTPDLHGKLTLQLRLSDAGAVTDTSGLPGGSANDPGLVGCIADAAKAIPFPRPGGTATITVPVIFKR